MSVDCSRFTFHPWKDYFGVVMQQGRVQLDADWNEWVAELARRLQAGAMDTLGPAEAGRAVVPSTTPTGFQITAQAGGFTIGVGRVYVDGLPAENHGGPANAWDPRLAETAGTAAISFFEQPYLPFNATNQPAPADVFNRPVLAGGPHLVYLDVWQREVTHLHDADLVEKAVGVDTTARTQIAWQVRVLQNPGNVVCATDDDDINGWNDITRPSGARLTTSTGDLTDDPNPCVVAPAAGYKGLENQLYRVEIHRGGPQNTATFKWSRDNATVATRVAEIHGGTRLVVDSLGRDDVLGFHPGEWLEILDDWHELHGLPGVLRRIRPGDGIVAATRSILFDDALPAGLFPVDSQGRTAAARNTRIRRWDQSNQVRRADGSVFHDLNASASSNGIPVPPAGTVLALENGILIELELPDGGEYRTGDYWVFKARAADGTIDILDAAPPRGIHHHYARLAVVTLPNVQEDCRIHWPPATGGQSCDCTVCVHPEAHNSGVATIQQAIDAVRARGGGTICLDVGTYLLRAPLNMANVRSLRMRGQGWRTVLQPAQAGGAIDVSGGIGVAIENLSIVGVAVEGAVAMIDIAHSADVQLSHLTIAALASGKATSAAIDLSGILLSSSIRDCVLVAEQTVVSATAQKYLLTANLTVVDNVLVGTQRGLSLDGTCLHYGQLRIADNLVLGCSQAGVALTGAAFPAATVTVTGNVLHAAGAGIVAGTDQLRIADNEIIAMAGRTAAHGIDLEAGQDKAALDRVQVTGNRLRGLRGHGIHVGHRLGQASFVGNIVENTGGGGLIMSANAAADYIVVDGNQFSNLGVDFNSNTLPFVGVLLLATNRADVTNNRFANVARDAVLSPLRAGVLTVATGELRIAGNRMYGIGPAGTFNLRTVGIGVAPGFVQVAVDDNTVSRLESSGDTAGTANWQALLIVGTLLGEAGQMQSISVPGAVILQTKSGVAYLTNNGIFVQAVTAIGTSVRGNRFHSQASLIPAAEVLAVRGCLFDQNDILVFDGDSAGQLAGRIVGDHASLANNRFSGSGEKAIFELVTDKAKYSVLGNLRTAPIIVNGTVDTSLPPPWNALNVAI